MTTEETITIPWKGDPELRVRTWITEHDDRIEYIISFPPEVMEEDTNELHNLIFKMIEKKYNE